MPAPRKDAALVARAFELLDAGAVRSLEEAAEHPELKGKVSARTLYREKARRDSLPAGPEPSPAPASDADKKIDELIGRSRTWRRVGEVLAAFARRHPNVAGELAADLRSLNL